MKKFFVGIVVTLIASVSAAFADPIEGVWKTQVDDGAYAYVEFVPCGDKYCAAITRTFNAEGEYQSANLGRQLVWDMVALGNGRYGKGKIWQPSTDKVFKSKMRLEGDTVYVSGCVLVLCKKQTWSRVSN